MAIKLRASQQIIAKLLEADEGENEFFAADFLPDPVKIIEVSLHHYEDDADGMRDSLGKWSDDAEPEAIIREGEHSGEFVMDLGDDDELPRRGRDYRFFIPANHMPHNPRNWAHVSEEDKNRLIAQYGSLEGVDRHYALEDWRRAEDYGNGWSYIGIRAKATIEHGDGREEEIESGGLWSVESDSGDYIREIEKEQLDELRGMLVKEGLSKWAIDLAFEDVSEARDIENLR